MINVLYCFDSNYNIQASVSMYSILENISEKINIYIIHKSETDKSFLSEKIKEHKMLNSLHVYKFLNNNLNVFNIEDAHISSATFFRIFLEDYLPNDINKIFYIDCDILCLNDPTSNLNEAINKLNESESVVAANTEEIYLKNPNFFNRIEMSGEKYFNAGVMLIDISRWIKHSIKEKSINSIAYLRDRAVLWDQDILNHVINGNYQDLDESLNFRTKNKVMLTNKLIFEKNLIFLHFAGASKPWDVRGPMFEGFEEFQNIFRELNSKNYFLVVKNRRKSLKELYRVLFIFQLSKIQFKIKYLYTAVTNIMFKRYE